MNLTVPADATPGSYIVAVVNFAFKKDTKEYLPESVEEAEALARISELQLAAKERLAKEARAEEEYARSTDYKGEYEYKQAVSASEEEYEYRS